MEEKVLHIEQQVVAGATARIRLEDVRTPIPGTGIPGYPETQQFRNCSTERDFQIEWIDVALGCRDYFLVEQCYVGSFLSWAIGCDGLSPHILAEKPKIAFPLCKAGLIIELVVKNLTGVDRPFIAELRGHEPISMDPLPSLTGKP